MTAVGSALRVASRPISFVGRRTANSAGGSITLQQPAGVQEGDFGLLLFRAAPTITAPDGWNTLATGIYWKLYGASEGSVSITSSTTKVAGALVVFRGVDQLDPIDEMSTKSFGTGPTGTTNPVTATVDGTLVNLGAFSAGSGSDLSVDIDYGQVLATTVYQDRRGSIAWGPQIHAGQTSKVATWTTAFSFSGGTATQFVLRRARLPE